MIKRVPLCTLIFLISFAIIISAESFGSWVMFKSDETPTRIKAFTKALNNDSVYMSLVCAKETDPHNSFLLLLYQNKLFETMEISDVRMKAVIDNKSPINIEWSYQKDILLMFDSQWLVKKLVEGKELSMNYRDINGRTELIFPLDGFGKAVEQMETFCGYKFFNDE